MAKLNLSNLGPECLGVNTDCRRHSTIVTARMRNEPSVDCEEVEGIKPVFIVAYNIGQLYGSSGWTVPLDHWPEHCMAAKCRSCERREMLSLFILVFSGFALIRFAVSQWRAIWISAANQPVSDSLQLTAGIDAAAIGAGDF